MSIWLIILAGATVALGSLVGILLTLLTLPGIWFMLIVAAACQFVFPEAPFSWWTIGICAGVALLAEIFEFVASAVGAKTTGGGRSGSIGSIIGATLGAIAGSILIPIPVAGTIIGAVGGAGFGALLAERGVAGKTWKQSTAIAGGAAAGRLTATIVKALVAVAIGIVLTVASVV